MSFYTLQDLLSGNPVYINKLKTDSLQQLYELLCNNAYVYKLQNGEQIRLLFSKDQFCHLIGFSYFGYEGIRGWDALKASPIEVRRFSTHPKFRMLQFRITSFNRLYFLLNNPDIYIYESSLYDEFNYKSAYFAVCNHNRRMYKLGVGITANGLNYPETLLIDRDDSTYNYYLLPEKLIAIISLDTIPKETFLKRHRIAKEINKILSNYEPTADDLSGIFADLKESVKPTSNSQL